MNLEWFREQIANAGRFLPEQVKFAELDRQAARLPSTDELPFFVPHLGGRVSPAWPHLRGAWTNLGWTHGVAHLWRTMLEGVALEYGLYKQALLNLHPEFRLSELRVTGGGEKSTLWNQIKADALGIPVVQIARSQGAPAGAALLAAYGIGLVGDLDAAAQQWITKGNVTKPNRKRAAYYKTRLQSYALLLEALNTWSQT
jgi:xylulokinase